MHNPPPQHITQLCFSEPDIPQVPRTQSGVPAVLEQKTTILWKCLYLLISLKDSSGLAGVYETNRRGGEENPVHERNTTVNVDKIRDFRPPYVWAKTIFFLFTLDHESTDCGFLYACYGNPIENRHSQALSVIPAAGRRGTCQMRGGPS